MEDMEIMARKEVKIWEGAHAGIVNISNVAYVLTNERLITTFGALFKSQEDIELVDIRKIYVDQSILDKVSNRGLVKISYKGGKMEMDINNPWEVKEKIRSAVLDAKDRLNISYRQEFA